MFISRDCRDLQAEWIILTGTEWDSNPGLSEYKVVELPSRSVWSANIPLQGASIEEGCSRMKTSDNLVTGCRGPCIAVCWLFPPGRRSVPSPLTATVKWEQSIYAPAYVLVVTAKFCPLLHTRSCCWWNLAPSIISTRPIAFNLFML
jgi:hypothetical protein